ncbi:FAD-binding oxidoreductase [soil metagenome]
MAAVTRLTPRVKSFFLKPPEWHGFRAGQHVDVRLSAPDGYMAERSYSIGSPPEATEVELVIEKLETGEISPFFHDVVHPCDTIELRGPIGGHFTWSRRDGGPLLLVGGGSGVVPLMSILRHRAFVAPDMPVALIYSARVREEIIFQDELLERAENDKALHLTLAVTRERPDDPRYHSGRIDSALIAKVVASLGAIPTHSYVCGATAFVDAATRYMIDAGVPFPSIKTERYGGDPRREGAGASGS